MKIFKHQHIGKRQNQEDSFGYNKNAFVICDGVGGHQKGEIASDFITKALLKKTEQEAFKSIEETHEFIKNLQSNLNKQLDKNPKWEGMGTTLVGFFKIAECWYAVHIGDSRLYWAKPGINKIWHTWDHSFVAQLVKAGDITREDARSHPRNNEIQKAIIAKKEKENPYNPEITLLSPIKKGDLILLCSDGVNEAWSDYELSKVLLDKKADTEKIAETIFSKSKKEANDNNTAILIEINTDISCKEPKTKGWILLEELKNDFDLTQADFIEEDNDSLLKKTKKNWWRFK